MATLTPAADAWVDQSRQNDNYPRTPRLQLRSTASGKGKRAFVFVALPFSPGVGARVLSAKLHLRAWGSGWSGTHKITAKRVTQKWTENKITWRRQPSVTDTNAAEVTVSNLSDGDLIELDVAAMVADSAAGAAWYGVRLEINTDTSGTRVYSSNEKRERLRPRLEIEWRPAIEAPVPLAPIGGQVVSLASPTLTWRTDWEEGEQVASQVQVNSSSDFSSPDYDSGERANGEGQWPLAGEYTVPDAATRWWRVRAKDDAGQWSEWSDPQEFTRVAKGTLTIISPALDPEDPTLGVVEETTPPIVAQLDGATLTQWTVELYREIEHSVARWEIVWSLGWVNEGPIAHTVPPNLIRSGETYMVIVRARDDQDRVATPGDPAEYIAQRIFRYERPTGKGLEPVSNLTATPDGPKVTLTWQRTLTPDEFCVRVDGKEVVQAIDPEDVRVDASTYSMDLWLLRPGVEHEIEVEAVVAMADPVSLINVHSEGNDTATVTLNVTGVWLADPTDGLAVELYSEGSEEPVDSRIRETGETLSLVGTRRAVRITDSIGGYEGNVRAYALSEADVQTFETLKGRARELRLIYFNRNLPVVLAESSPSPWRVAGVYHVEFDWVQSSEYADTFEVAA